MRCVTLRCDVGEMVKSVIVATDVTVPYWIWCLFFVFSISRRYYSWCYLGETISLTVMRVTGMCCDVLAEAWTVFCTCQNIDRRQL